INIFDSFNTHNFELVLSALRTAQLVCDAIGQDAGKIELLYSITQNALVEAVKAVHLPWALLPEDVRRAIREELLTYDYVYSTNYDLLLYWSVMTDNGEGFKDYFWGPRFDIANVEIWNKVTKVLFLHGGLHLYRALSGQTIKRKAEQF